jgi:hypothetical protein
MEELDLGQEASKPDPSSAAVTLSEAPALVTPKPGKKGAPHKVAGEGAAGQTKKSGIRKGDLGQRLMDRALSSMSHASGE